MCTLADRVQNLMEINNYDAKIIHQISFFYSVNKKLPVKIRTIGTEARVYCEANFCYRCGRDLHPACDSRLSARRCHWENAASPETFHVLEQMVITGRLLQDHCRLSGAAHATTAVVDPLGGV
ncbi:hypothetical protein AVEN_216047-1 [Araneus ventricosus]|uniref:Uncharacterized protein n=1 Tax=Araneus ventricosus TaxID=182803 RepID=A0A4Y2K6K1_ARAVE|nr:hypothetical protein AVEN_216047-1 [Araneus ventricosus]